MGLPAIKLTTGGTAVELITHVGGSDFREALNSVRAGKTHMRDGVVLASHTWKNVKKWIYNCNSGTHAYMESLRDFQQAGVFYLYPDVDITAVYYTVFWMEDEFEPQYMAPDKYKISATFMETTIGAGTPVYIDGVGDQTVEGNLTVTDNLTVGGILDPSSIATVRSNGNIYVNYDGVDSDSYLYFFENGSADTRYLKWEDSSNWFEFNDTVNIPSHWIRAASFVSYGDAYLNYDGPNGDSKLYFYKSGSQGAHLGWDSTNTRFVATDAFVTDGLYMGIDAAGVGISQIQFSNEHGTLTYLTGNSEFTFSQKVAMPSLFVTGDTQNAGAVSAMTFSGITKTKSLTLLEPTDDENITLFYADRDITLDSIQSVVVGSGSPSVTWYLSASSDRTDQTPDQVTTAVTTTSTTTGNTTSSFQTTAIPAGDWVWLDTSATGGTVNHLHLTIKYRED